MIQSWTMHACIGSWLDSWFGYLILELILVSWLVFFARFCELSNPTKSHWNVGLCILQYLKANLNRGIFFVEDTNPSHGIQLHGWIDFDWVCNIDSRRSTIDYLFTWGVGSISWSSKKQPLMAFSFTEAEYRVACYGTCEAVWLCWLLDDLDFP